MRLDETGTLQDYTQGKSSTGTATKVPAGAPRSVRCKIDARGAAGVEVGGVAEEETRWALYLPPSAVPLRDSELTVGTRVYRIVGQPWAAQMLHGLDHWEATAVLTS